MSRITPARATIAAALAMLAFVLGWAVHVLAHDGPRRTGSNYVDVPHFVENLAGGDTVCQQETVPKGTGALAMLVTSYNKPTSTFRVSITDASGHRLAVGGLRHGFVEGQNLIPLAQAVPRTTAAQLCFRNEGPGPLTIGGENVVAGLAASKNGGPTTGRMSIQWFRPGQESYFSIAGLVLARLAHGKPAWSGPWVSVLFVVLLAAALAGGTYLAVRRCD